MKPLDADISRKETTSAEQGIWRPFRSLLTAQAASALLGLVFWVLAARLIPPHDLGIAAAVISFQTVLGVVTVMGLSTMLISELGPQPPPRQRTMVRRSLLVAAVSSAVLGAIVVAAHGLLTTNLREALADPVGDLGFVLGVVAAAWALIVDNSALAVGRSRVQVTRNFVASALRFPLILVLVALGLGDAHAVQLCWVLPLLFSTPVALHRLKLPRGDHHSPRLRVDLANFVGLALRNHALNLTLSSATLLIPVVAALTLTSVGNAEFAIAWMVVTFVFLPPYLISTALFAHGANVSTDEFRRSTTRTLPASLILSGVLCVGAWILGEPILLLFGGPYARESWQLLAILAPAGLWMLFKDHLVALWRSQRRFVLASGLAGAGLVIEVSGATLGALSAGSVGLCVGWLVGMLVEVPLSFPLLRRAFGGLRWQWPSVTALRRSQAGQVSIKPLAALLVILVAAASATWAVRSHTSMTTGSSGTAEPGDQAKSCQVDADHPGPLIDLGVQAATGHPAHPLLSEAQVARLVRVARHAGAQVISTTASFRALQPQEGQPYQFEGMDRVIAAARAANLPVHLQLTGVPSWALDDPTGPARRPPESGAELARWTTFVSDLMQHVGDQVAYVEVWNQPNDEKYWPTGPNPVQFVRLLSATYDTVHQHAPDTQVISGGLLGNDVGYLEKMYAAMQTLGLHTSPFDLLGVQPFTGAVAPDISDSSQVYARQPSGTFDGNFDGYIKLHAVMAAHDDAAKSIYISDFGYSTQGSRGVQPVSDGMRARYLTQAFEVATCSPFVEALSWYALTPNHWDSGDWTLLDRAGHRSRTYDALTAWSAARHKRTAGAAG